MSDKRATVLRPAGYMAITDPEFGTKEADSLQCVHCQHVWLVVPGSGRKRGWCYQCMGPTCSPHCHSVCVPFEKVLDYYEAGILPTMDPVVVAGLADRLPISVRVPSGLPAG